MQALLHFFNENGIWALGLFLLHYGLFLTVAWFLLSKRRNPLSTTIWLSIVFSFPILGVVLYSLLGVNRVPSQEYNRESRQQRKRVLSDLHYQQQQNRLMYRTCSLRRRRHVCPLDSMPENILLFNQILDKTGTMPQLLAGNSLQMLTSGELAIETMLDEISKAKSFILVQSYIIGRGVFGKRLMKILAAKANAGVKVYVLYDAIGSFNSRWHLFFRKYSKIENLNIRAFTHARFVGMSILANCRNHRKICVIDSKVGFIGGVNIHDGYLNRRNCPAIGDLHFKLTGPSVADLQNTFLRDWNFITDEALILPETEPDFHPGNTKIRVVNNGPTETEYDIGPTLFVAAILTAKRQIIITTPYFIPSDEVTRALLLAARKGVAITVIVPGCNNHPLIAAASRSHYSQLMRANIKIWEQHPPFNHTKAMTIDDELAIAGSSNFDPRSFHLNYETNLVIIDKEEVKLLQKHLLSQCKNSRLISKLRWQKRSVWNRIIDNACNLFQPNL